MDICICHDKDLKEYLTKKGLNYQASGTTPNTKTTYWVYYESPAYIQFVKEYKGEEV